MRPLRHLQPLRAAYSRFRKRGAPVAVILMYHRVSAPGVDPWRLNVTPEHFAEHLAVLRRLARPTSLTALTAALASGKVPDRAAVVTFDDGYANNLHEAAPLLDQADLTATVFVATGYTGAARGFWWDELGALLLHDRVLPATLEVAVGGVRCHWPLSGAPVLPAAALSAAALATSRLALYKNLWRVLRRASPEARYAALDRLREWSGVVPSVPPSQRPMTGEEIVQLASDSQVEIGAHTVTHPYLPWVPPSVQRQEILDSRAHLERTLCRPVTSFAYPFGGWDATTIGIVREAGFTCAVTVQDETAWRGSDRVRLPRFTVGDWDGDQFERHLAHWFAS